MSMNDMMLEGRRGILRRGEAPSENTPGREKEESDSPPIPRLNASAASSPAVQPRVSIHSLISSVSLSHNMFY